MSGNVGFCIFDEKRSLRNKHFLFIFRGEIQLASEQTSALGVRKMGRSREGMSEKRGGGVWRKGILIIFSHSLAVSFPLRANGRLIYRLGETMKQNTQFSVQILSIEIQPYTSCFKD